MATNGARSLHLRFINMTSNVYDAAKPTLVSGSWIPGEEPVPHLGFPPLECTHWGVMTNDPTEGLKGKAIIASPSFHFDFVWSMDSNNTIGHSTYFTNGFSMAYKIAHTLDLNHQTLIVKLRSSSNPMHFGAN